MSLAPYSPVGQVGLHDVRFHGPPVEEELPVDGLAGPFRVTLTQPCALPAEGGGPIET